MKTSRQTKFRIAALIVVINAFLLFPELPPGKLFGPARRDNPASGKMITLRVTTEGERPLRVSQLEGGLIKIGGEGKATYSFSPTVTGPDSGTVTIKGFSDGEAGSSASSPGSSRKRVLSW